MAKEPDAPPRVRAMSEIGPTRYSGAGIEHPAASPEAAAAMLAAPNAPVPEPSADAETVTEYQPSPAATIVDPGAAPAPDAPRRRGRKTPAK